MVLVLIVASVPLACAWYFTSAEIERPPLGRFNAKDVGLVMIAAVVFPLLYLVIPIPVVATLFALAFWGIGYTTLRPLLSRPTALVATTLLLACPLVLYWLVGGGATSLATLAANNAVIIIAIIGVCNLYVQNGIRASDVVVFLLALAVYDIFATTITGLMGRLIDRLSELPLIPGLFWGTGPYGVGLGMGDILVLSLWALVVYKAWGLKAFPWAAALAPGFVFTIAVLQLYELIPGTVPVMTMVTPFVLLQYVLFRKVWGPEASVRIRRRGVEDSSYSADRNSDETLLSLLFVNREVTESSYAGSYLALANSRVIGTGGTAIEAVTAAAKAGRAPVEACVYIPDVAGGSLRTETTDAIHPAVRTRLDG